MVVRMGVIVHMPRAGSSSKGVMNHARTTRIQRAFLRPCVPRTHSGESASRKTIKHTLAIYLPLLYQVGGC